MVVTVKHLTISFHLYFTKDLEVKERDLLKLSASYIPPLRLLLPSEGNTNLTVCVLKTFTGLVCEIPVVKAHIH